MKRGETPDAGQNLSVPQRRGPEGPPMRKGAGLTSNPPQLLTNAPPPIIPT